MSKQDASDVMADLIEDLKEMQEQELQQDFRKNDQLIRQKDQLQKLKQDYQKKDQTIQALKEEVHRLKKYKPYHEKYNAMKDMLQQCIRKLEEHEYTNSALTDTIQQLQLKFQDMAQEQGQYSHIEKLNMELIEEKQRIQEQYYEIEQIYYESKEEWKNKELSYHKQVENLRMAIDQQNRQLDESQNEIHDLKRLIMSKEKENMEIIQRIKSNQDAAQEQIVRKTQDNIKLKSQTVKTAEIVEKHQKKILSEYQVIKKQLDDQQNFIKNQEKQINQFINSIQQMKEKLKSKDQELKELKQMNSKITTDFDNVVKKMVSQEQFLQDYRNENLELKKYISALLEKQQLGGFYKDEIENVKRNLFQQQQRSIPDADDT